MAEGLADTPASFRMLDLREVRPGNRDAVFYRKVARICQQVHRAGGAKDDAMNKAKALTTVKT
jgi:hypothetical protein